jgi:hypothetical protein
VLFPLEVPNRTCCYGIRKPENYVPVTDMREKENTLRLFIGVSVIGFCVLPVVCGIFAILDFFYPAHNMPEILNILLVLIMLSSWYLVSLVGLVLAYLQITGQPTICDYSKHRIYRTWLFFTWLEKWLRK